MKLILLLVISVLSFSSAMSQDSIYTRKGKIIESKISRINKKRVFYTHFKQAKPRKSMRISSIDSIKFQDGNIVRYARHIKPNSMMFGLGTGMSTGGLGAKLQGPLFNTERTAIHVGLGLTFIHPQGYYEGKKANMLNLGVKQYLFNDFFYLNTGISYAGNNVYLFDSGIGIDIASVSRPKQLGVNFALSVINENFMQRTGIFLIVFEAGIFFRFG